MDTINEIERDQRSQTRQVREDAELFHDLMRHKGWARYMTLVETVGQNYHAGIMAPLESVLGCTKMEFNKGVLSGLTLAAALPNMKIKEAQELRSKSGDDE
jgi:hypothetical protein